MLKKYFFISFILINFLNSASIDLNTGWNLVGVKDNISTTEIIDTSDEVIHYYDGENWDYYTSLKTGIIPKGSGIWLKSSTFRNLDIGTSTFTKELINEWELITSTNGSLDLSIDPSIHYAWKYNNEKWSLYHPSLSQDKFSTFTNIKEGEGVWIKRTNFDIGNSKLFIKNGNFGTVNKDGSTATTEIEFLEDIKNIYNMKFKIDENTSDLDYFVIGIKFTRLSTNSEYFYFVEVNTDDNKTLASPKVDLKKANGEAIGGALIEAPMLELNNSILTLNFHKISKYLMKYDYYNLEQLKDRLSTNTDYKIEIYTYNLDLENSSKISSKIQIVNNLFPVGSSKVEGILSIK